MRINEILDEYRRGNADKRMSMFLCYRELRDEFTCLDQNDFGNPFTESFSEGHGKQRKLMRLVRETFTRMCPAGAPDRAKS